MKISRLFVALVALLAPGALLAQSAAQESRRASLTRVEGVVVSIAEGESATGERGALIARLETRDGAEVTLALAPAEVLEEIGFVIEEGDRIRARVFEADPTDPGAPRGVQKIQNVSRGTMTRLRTLYRIPLWSNAGRWQGGPVRGGGHAGAGSGPQRRGGR